MSFRSAARPIARFAASARGSAQPVQIARRAASSSSGTGGVKPPKSNDLPWIIGSTVGFGSLAAFLLLPSKADSHAATHSQEHAKVRAEINESAPTAKPGQDQIQNTESLSRDVKSEDPKEIHRQADRPPSSIPAKRDQLKTMDDRNLENPDLKPESQSGGQNASDTAKAQAQGEGNKENEGTPSNAGYATGTGSTSGSGSGSGSAEQAESDEGKAGKEAGEPTQKEIKDSILQAERANTPKAAMDEEAHGNDGPSQDDRED
ncbi:hypothetical protein I317_02829 [Kwoniella heveanensis CBS 569]|uniref:Uncharacterized protein n=1 Tax=Kwoniella heveanensis BCC8398 TaxID=1296120 RepID=A0A1B9GS36_9TREE|nr:hypothetical protein I316_04739 [Kwoniella heveanensis BCC8398]OCF43261.1 hypothetical protein I317_02829 [Kwoniella heveanensis CBS 569]